MKAKRLRRHSVDSPGLKRAASKTQEKVWWPSVFAEEGEKDIKGGCLKKLERTLETKGVQRTAQPRRLRLRAIAPIIFVKIRWSAGDCFVGLRGELGWGRK